MLITRKKGISIFFIKCFKIVNFIILALFFYVHTLEAQEDVLGNSNNKYAVYKGEMKEHNKVYNWLWGEHYRRLYYVPVSVKEVSLSSLFGGLELNKQIPDLYGAVFEDSRGTNYLIKPLASSSSFVKSGFFQNVYNKDDFDETYIGDFIKEAYTIEHPYLFKSTNYLAQRAGLMSPDINLYYIKEASNTDTIVDGSSFENKLSAVYSFPKLENYQLINDVSVLFDKLHSGNSYKIDTALYIRSRLFDMLTGDWDKVPENWLWMPKAVDNDTVYIPIALNRGHAFTKAEGFLFKGLLGMLGLNFIASYDGKIKNVKKFNTLGYPLDVAFTSGCDESEWLYQARSVKNVITSTVIEDAFAQLPEELQGDDINYLKLSLKERLNNLDKIASKYYKELQQTPSISASNHNDTFKIEFNSLGARVQIYNKNNEHPFFDHFFTQKGTQEIWLYGLEGDDNYVIEGNANIPVYLIGGEGENNYNSEKKTNKIKIYEYSSQKNRLDTVSNVKIIYPRNEEESLSYDYKKLRYTEFNITPIGIYDSDLGVNLGTSVSYTVYGFRRAPYTRRHQISYDYVNGITYQGIFPDYDSKRSLHVSAYVGSPAYFSNFFGFGNNTEGFKNESKTYNRVHIEKYSLAPALYYTINNSSEVNMTSTFELNRVGNPDKRNRYINTVYDDNSSIFDYKLFWNLSATYECKYEINSFLSQFSTLATIGWNMNVGNIKRNYPYLKADIGLHLKLTERLTFATQMKGQLIFTDKYEFYQSATTELRGFRDNRFIGKQSFYQYNDLRFDMGELKNPFAPLTYGVFGGVDYGRVWYPGENSKRWHSSYGGGVWLTILRKFTGKFSYFASKDDGRFAFELGMGF